MEITFYSTHCPKCKVLELKMKALDLPFKEVNDVDTMLELGFKSAPVLVIDGKIYDFAAANKFLNEVKANGIHQC